MTAQLSRTSEQPKKAKSPKSRHCAHCRQEFMPFRPLQKACSTECAILIARRNSAQAEQRAKAAERKAVKARKEKLKTRSDWLREAQQAFNQWVRQRDAGQPCICCGKAMDWTGNKVDSGHYRSCGSAPHLRFNEDNAHAQDKQCNRFGAGRAVDYRIGLIARIGLARVEALEADNTPRKWSIDDLKAIKANYRAKLRELKGKA